MVGIHKSIKYYIGLILCILCLVNTQYVWASERVEDEQENTTGFVIETVIPENQVDKTKSYFYLSVRPGKEQTIKVKVKSMKEEACTVSLYLTDAMTGNNGNIDYGQKNPIYDESLVVPLTEIASIEPGDEEVTVENYEEKIIKIKITPPKEKFSGVILGGIRAMGGAADDDSEEKSTGIGSEYGYTVALMLTEDNAAFNHGAELNLKSVEPRIEYGQKVIAAKIQNDQPKVLKELIMEATITKQGQDTVLKERKIKNMSVAPNTNFDFLVQWGMEDMEPGTYTMHIKASGDDREWQWDEDFEITAPAAAAINEEAVYKVVVPKWVYYAVGGLAIVFVGLVAFLLYRGKKWKLEKSALVEGRRNDEENSQ